jgi:GT2 family glycosyltransferase
VERIVKPAGNKHDCDVIIVNYNTGELLTHCVQSVFAAGANKIIVVDNASHDNSINYLRQQIQTPSLWIMMNQRNVGFATACNIGAHSANANTLLFLNPDCTIAPDAIDQLMRVLHSDTTIGMTGGLLLNPDGTEQPGGRRLFPTPQRAFARAFGLGYLSRKFPAVFPDFALHRTALPTVPTQIEAISGACMLVKRAAIEDVGFWDADYFLHCEDLDLCLRFQYKDWKIYFVPAAKVTHVWRVSSRKRPFFVEWHKHHGMVRFYKKFFQSGKITITGTLIIWAIWLRFLLISVYHSLRLITFKFRSLS